MKIPYYGAFFNNQVCCCYAFDNQNVSFLEAVVNSAENYSSEMTISLRHVPYSDALVGLTSSTLV